MISSEIIPLYQKQFTDIEKLFPVETQKLISVHKSSINTILEKLKLKNLSPEAQRQIDLEFKKISSKNNEIYKSKLTSYLSDKFKDIDRNIHNGYYKTIDEFKRDVDNFKENVLRSASQGPNKEAIIFKFILEQIIIGIEIIINSHSNSYKNELNDKQSLLNKMSSNIKDTKIEAEKILKDIALKEALIKQMENDKTSILKLSSSNADKLSKVLKEKGNEIKKLNEKIEESENNN